MFVSGGEEGLLHITVKSTKCTRRKVNRPFSIMLAFFSAFFWKTSIFFFVFLEEELLALSVIFNDSDPDFSTQKDK